MRGGLAQPLVMVGFPRQVILITYGMDYIAPQTETLVYFLLTTAASVHMWDAYRREAIQVLKKCDLNLSYSNVLKRHERTHAVEKPFKCSQCDKSFLD